jgi:hypothetical protein
MSKTVKDSPIGKSEKKKRNQLSLSTAQKAKLLRKLDRGLSVMRLPE